jgi:hypothetical protein
LSSLPIGRHIETSVLVHCKQILKNPAYFLEPKIRLFFIGKKIKYGIDTILCLYLEPKSGLFYKKKNEKKYGIKNILCLYLSYYMLVYIGLFYMIVNRLIKLRRDSR